MHAHHLSSAALTFRFPCTLHLIGRAFAGMRVLELESHRRVRYGDEHLGIAVDALSKISVVLRIAHTRAECKTTVETEANCIEDGRLTSAVLPAEQHDRPSFVSAGPWQEIDLLPPAIHP